LRTAKNNPEIVSHANGSRAAGAGSFWIEA